MKEGTKENKGIVQWLINNKIRICVGICVFYLGIIGFIAWVNKDNENLPENLYYVSQIVSAMFVIAGTAIAVIQYIFNSNTARNNADKQRKIEAAKMADEFRRNVIPLINNLSIAYSNTELRKDIIDYLNNSRLEYFNRDEVRRLFPGDTCLQYRVQIAKNYLMQTSEEFRHLDERYRCNKEMTETERKRLGSSLNEMIWDSLINVSGMSTELSNTLEYMCICFNTNIADDETVYQSLHNVFFWQCI